MMVLLGNGIDELDPKDKDGRTPLTLAIVTKNILVTKTLLEMGAEIEARDKAERTPLMNAARVGSLELVDMLLERKVDINAKTPLGDTATSFAQKSGNTDVLSRFIQLGHSIRPQSSTGRPQSSRRPPS